MNDYTDEQRDKIRAELISSEIKAVRKKRLIFGLAAAGPETRPIFHAWAMVRKLSAPWLAQSWSG